MTRSRTVSRIVAAPRASWTRSAVVFLALFVVTALGYALTPDGWGYVLVVPIIGGVIVGAAARATLYKHRER
jgi:predicted Co/Zn/Cd cation transporter (cation efflux family)